MVSPVNWGILGTATIARVCLIPAIQQVHNSRVRAIASRSRESARRLAEEHDISRAYGSYDELLADPEIEVVYIPLPNHLHHTWTLRALAAGKHVLCEKPLALNAGQARDMVTAARAANRLLMEAFMYRFHPRSRAIKQEIDSGAIGRPRLLRAAFTFRLSDPENIRLRPEMGGGALLDAGCYGVSVVRWLLRREPVQVQATAEIGPTGVDLNTAALLTFEGNILAVIEASFQAALQQTYSIAGSRGIIELPHNAFIPWEAEAVYYRRGVEDENPVVERVPGADEYQLMVEHFAGAVQKQHPLAFDPQDSIQNMVVLDAVTESFRTHAAVPVAREPFQGLNG